ITSITLENGGSGYTSAPVVVISSGGWRRQNSFTDPADDEIISAGAGILVIRRHPNGAATFIQSDNPSN
ncbi:MAG: hypothetical protein VCA36_00080, partial [Opitutales bacterium]